MAFLPLPLQTQSCYLTTKPHTHLHKSLPTKPKFTVLSQESSSSEPTIEQQQPTQKPLSPGLGFGSVPDSEPAQLYKSNATLSKKKKGRGERGSVIRRRSPVEKPAFLGKTTEGLPGEQQSVNEGAFVFAWLGLGGVILLQGLALASSGFLPEEWDKFLVKYLYPAFTPTVFLFVAGSVVYGVTKYLQNESLGKDE